MKKKVSIAIFVILAVPLFIFVVFPLAKNLGGILIYSIFGVPEIKEAKLAVVADGVPFVVAGDRISAHLQVQAAAPINLVSGTIDYPKDLLSVESVSLENSVVNLWIKDPTRPQDTEGRIDFGGGIQQEGGFRGEGTVFNINFRAKKPGIAIVGLPQASTLAHDGQGTEYLSEKRAAVFLVREPGQPSPDFNNDGKLGIADIAILMFNVARSYNGAYDLNRDGKVNFTDVTILRFFLNASKIQG